MSTSMTLATTSSSRFVSDLESEPTKRFKLIAPEIKVKATAKKLSDKLKNKQQKCVLNTEGVVKNFSDIQVSTRTAIVFTNCTIDLAGLFQYTPITDYKPPVNRRGRKPSNHIEAPMPVIPFGGVVRVAHELKVRGVQSMKPKSDTTKPATVQDDDADGDDEEETVAKCPVGSDLKKHGFFRHCVVLDIAISNEAPNKFKNVKIYSNGKMQITGCKSDEQYYSTVIAVFNLLSTVQEYTGRTIVQCDEPVFKAVFNTVMQNMDFNMGFSIFRNKLDHFINNHTEFRSVFDGTNNPGVNIRIPISETDSKLMSLEYNRTTKQTTRGFVNYADYMHLIKGKKEREHTFLIFHTGHVIFTSAGPDMESVFYRVINMLTQNRQLFEVKEAAAAK